MPTEQLRAIGREFHARGWSLGTSSNYSIVLQSEPVRLLLTASGKDKSALGPDDFVRVDATGRVIDGSTRKSSAETLLHCLIADLVPAPGGPAGFLVAVERPDVVSAGIAVVQHIATVAALRSVLSVWPPATSADQTQGMLTRS